MFVGVGIMGFFTGRISMFRSKGFWWSCLRVVKRFSLECFLIFLKILFIVLEGRRGWRVKRVFYRGLGG